MTYQRISSVQELCELDPSAIDFALSDQVEHLTDLLVEAENAAEKFFARNFVTQGMERCHSACNIWTPIRGRNLGAD
jgi:hypothetical protein